MHWGGSVTLSIYSGSTLIGEQSNQTLDAHTSKLVNTQAYLFPGTNLVSVKLDATNHIDESNESNNSAQVTVLVDSACK